VRATDEELAAKQLEVTAPPKITFGMFQVKEGVGKLRS
jgi:hypothetical protein